jgi:lysophospholipase L1-like esterase
MKAGITRFGARLALLLGAVVLSVLLAEALLQLGALVMRATGREAPAGFRTDRHRVLAFGDSNTYGLYLEPDQAYPQQLEAMWNARADRAPIEVVNLGYPGTNSSVVLREFPRALRSLEPDVAVVMVGVNDFWTEPVEVVSEAPAIDRFVAWVNAHSRVLRFLAILVPKSEDADAPEPAARTRKTIPREWTTDIEVGGEVLSFGFGGTRRGSGADGKRLVANLERLAREARSQGIKLVLMTYPSEGELYRYSNRMIRTAALASETPLVDLAKAFKRACPDEACEELLFPDRHPTAAGCGLIARTLEDAIGDLIGP